MTAVTDIPNITIPGEAVHDYALPHGGPARCDSCGVRAKSVWWTDDPNSSGIVTLCGHHHKGHSYKLISEGWECIAFQEDRPKERSDNDEAAFV